MREAYMRPWLASQLGTLAAVPGVAVVTGAGRGFGRAIARAARGARLHRARDRHRRRAPPRPRRRRSAASRWSSTSATPRRTAPPRARRPSAGPLEVWVNNAGVMRPAPPGSTRTSDVRLTCDVNLLGVVWGSLAAVDAMRAGAGREPARRSTSARSSSLGPVPGPGALRGHEARRARLHRLAPGRPARRRHPDHRARALPGRGRHGRCSASTTTRRPRRSTGPGRAS